MIRMEMKRNLSIFLTFVLLVSCDGKKKHNVVPFVDSYTAEVKNDTSIFVSEVSEKADNDTLIVVEDFIPATADASFLDFLYNFASDEDFQLSRIIFPVSFYNDTVVHRLTEEEWQFDPLFSNEEIYTVLFDKEDELELEKEDSFKSVQLDWIYLKDRHIKRYYFEMNDNIWHLEAVNKEKVSRLDNGEEDFYDFYVRFATDSVFQSERINTPLLFSTVDPEDEFSVLETTLEVGQWFAFRPPMPSVRLSNIRYGQSETVTSNTKIIEFKGFGNGFNNTLYFRKMAGVWKLVKFEDLGD